MALELVAMALERVATAPELVAMASELVAMASGLVATPWECVATGRELVATPVCSVVPESVTGLGDLVKHKDTQRIGLVLTKPGKTVKVLWEDRDIQNRVRKSLLDVLSKAPVDVSPAAHEG